LKTNLFSFSEIFNQVWEWNELLTPVTISQILDKYFFPKWIQTLVIWLNQSPNFDQVSRWYTGWKNLFTIEVLQQTNINEHFRRALELMQRAIGTNSSMTDEMTAPLPPTISTATVKPPSLLDMKITPPATLEFKELVSQKCAERGIIFAPMPGRREMGKQVYRVGKSFCYIDRTVCMISSDGGMNWAPISLTSLLEKSVTG
jgi:tuftelin-interacting protein 11